MSINRREGWADEMFEVREVTYDDRNRDRLGTLLETSDTVEEARFKAARAVMDSGSMTFEVEIHKTSREVIEVYDKKDVLGFFKKVEVAPLPDFAPESSPAPTPITPAFSDAGPVPEDLDDEIPF